MSRAQIVAGVALALMLGAAGEALAQCMLANPSFEVSGTGGNAFAGWNQFGPVGLAASAVHGSAAARATGPNTHGWDVSGFWQSLDCAPGQRWSASVCVSHSSASPLSGQSAAIVNVEWRDAGDDLISYESHTVADPTSPPDRWRCETLETLAAPPGTASIHFLLGVLQGPTDPTPEVAFDAATCVSLGPPTLESVQWNDFPSGRALSFSGRTWRVKGPGYYGPGPNLFDNSASAAWIDAAGRLHLTIHRIGGSWYSSEVALVDALGYGDYVFTTRGRLDQLDRNTVLGLFVWEYGPCYDEGYLWWNAYNEIDVEFSRWGYAGNPNAQFVAQPASIWGNTHRFNVAFADSEVTSHAMRWLPDRVEFRSWRGGPGDETQASLIESWVYSGDQLPRPDMPRVHLNLWQLAPPAVTQEVVLDAFTFRPACPSGDCGTLDVPPRVAPSSRLAAAPNPFATTTTIRFSIPLAGDVELSIYDLAGRRTRRLVQGMLGAGEHAVRWDRRSDDGRRIPAGVYFYRLRSTGIAEIERLVVLQ